MNIFGINKNKELKFEESTNEFIETINPNESIKNFVNRVNAKNSSLILAKQLIARNIYFGISFENKYLFLSDIINIIDNKNNNIFIEDIMSILDYKNSWAKLFETIYDNNTLEYMELIQKIFDTTDSIIKENIRSGSIYLSNLNIELESYSKFLILNEYNNILKIKNIEQRAIELFYFVLEKQIFWRGNEKIGLLIANKELISHNKGVLCIRENCFNEFNLLVDKIHLHKDTKLKSLLYSNIIRV